LPFQARFNVYAAFRRGVSPKHRQFWEGGARRACTEERRTWEIYAYKNADSLFSIFNAAAAILGCGDYMAAVAAVALCGFFAALVAYTFAPEKLRAGSGWPRCCWCSPCTSCRG
jgi:hypothetical protein